MKKKVIKIDEDKCIGCGLCANACMEGAIGIVDGKAKLLNPNHCDGLGNCIPECPTEAITFEEREVEVGEGVADGAHKNAEGSAPVGCPGMSMKTLKEQKGAHGPANVGVVKTDGDGNVDADPVGGAGSGNMQSELMQWPVQINLVPVTAPYFENADLLIAADCTAYSYAGFHEDIMKGRITLIGCPKLDPTDYSEKLTAIISRNNIRSVTVARMEVPCCGGIQAAVETAVHNSGKLLPTQVITISTDGNIIK